MVADQCQPSTIHDFVHASRGVATVADDVSQAERLIDLWAVFEDRLESLPVGVNVGQNGDFHAGFPYRRG